MYLLSIKRNPKSVLKNVKNGILLNFLKDNPETFEPSESTRKSSFKVEIIEHFWIEIMNFAGQPDVR